jgi:hypothetical protein
LISVNPSGLSPAGFSRVIGLSQKTQQFPRFAAGLAQKPQFSAVSSEFRRKPSVKHFNRRSEILSP